MSLAKRGCIRGVGVVTSWSARMGVEAKFGGDVASWGARVFTMASPLDIYFSAIADAAEAAVGVPLGDGTVVAPEADRAGGGSATSYPTPRGTVIWCDPALVDTLSALLTDAADGALDSERFASLAVDAGASVLGFGRNRVLEGPLQSPRALPGAVSVQLLDRDEAGDVALLAELAAASSDDDLDEADLDLDNLDPFYAGLIEDGRLVAYACGRPSEIDERFDDIGVLVHPGYRQRGLGASAVAAFVERRQAADPSRLMLYRCTTENAGSNAVSESLGFTLAHTIGAVRFPEFATG